MTTADQTEHDRRERYMAALRDADPYALVERRDDRARLADAVMAVADAETTDLRALAADATEYRVPVPDNGGTTLLVRRQNLAHGTGWAVSIPAYGGGRAWTTEGWQESISALTVDRLFCWPDAPTAITEARRALTA
ncbi:hypothetical protein [Streptomyces cahuitamycinicus]|uniref:Uncharacterized protein n=1 Tax=Streptomyces cahuitamycinicus TaxID=2070367 RepID=A0A2N8TL78_9ACTN|nr:hypothetical protein [Streptomyces cahuitamycinicus]PNG19743.1 hypothetical protein C1J00_24065 [Streptomyces cahuitamycinicus]